jgi:phage host-nuclease inhibitor protein Gam
MSVSELSLQDYLLGEVPQQEGFAITDQGGAEWALKKLVKIAQEDAADDAMAQAEIERIQTWLTERKTSRQHDREFFEGHLTKYHVGVLLDNPKQKTIKLPHGTLKARKLSDKVEYDDKSLIEWAKGNNHLDFIRTKEEIVKDKVKEALLENGESIPGVSVVPQGVKYTVEVSL